MAMEKIGDGLKKLLLAGIGAAAVTVEKSTQIVDELVKKGEITVEQGKELNKELQHNVKKTWDARKADAESLEEKIAKMGAEELAVLKKAIHDAENVATETLTGMTEEEIKEADKKAREEAQLDEVMKEEGYAPAFEEDKPES